MQLNRYRSGGTCPPHRDALQGSPTLEVDAGLPPERFPRVRERHPESDEPGAPLESVEGYAQRSIGIIVQLSTRRDDGSPLSSPDAREYTGGDLQVRIGTAAEPELAQRLHDGLIVDAIRSNATRVRMPTCAGDAVFFTGLTVHEVLPVASGTRESLVWWALGHPPLAHVVVEQEVASRAAAEQLVWAGRSPWNRDLARS